MPSSDFLYFSRVALCFEFGNQMLDPSVSRAEIENEKMHKIFIKCPLERFLYKLSTTFFLMKILREVFIRVVSASSMQ